MEKPDKARGGESFGQEPPDSASSDDRMDETGGREDAEERDKQGERKPVLKDAGLFRLEHYVALAGYAVSHASQACAPWPRFAG